MGRLTFRYTIGQLFKVMQMYKDIVDKTTPTPFVETPVELLRDTLPVLRSYKHMQMEVKRDNSLVNECRTTKMFYYNHWSTSVSTSHYLVQKYLVNSTSCKPAAPTK